MHKKHLKSLTGWDVGLIDFLSMSRARSTGYTKINIAIITGEIMYSEYYSLLQFYWIDIR